MIPYIREMDFEYGRADQVSPLLRRVVARNPGPFTYLGTGTYIVGHGEVAVVDPGPALDDHLNAILDATRGERITHILTTHTHADHSPLSDALQARTGAVIYGLADPGGPSGEHGDLDFRPDISVEDGQDIAGPGWTLRVLATPGHASNHLAYALLEEHALLVGDHIMGWSTTVVSPPDGDMGAYYESLNRVQARHFNLLWPSHGPPVHEVSAFIDAYRAHRLDREAQILAQLAAGRTRITDIVPTLYAKVDPSLHPAAARSVLAHLIHLVRTGQVTAREPLGLESDFSLAGSGYASEHR
jgi:glyoxylase-like metal-dependent hydrolase (beta-lactamase superfamily II)